MNPSRIAQARKLLVAVAGYVAALLAYGLLPDPWDKYAAAGLAFLASVGIYRTQNVLTPQQLMAQPNYSPAVSHVPMPVSVVAYDPGANVKLDQMHVAEKFGKPGLGAGPHRDPLTGRYSKEP
jgi:hypothetical protein